MSLLSDKIKRAREFRKEIEGWKLILRRPTDYERDKAFRKDDIDALDIAKMFVVGWEEVTEAKFIVSGSSDPLPFDPEAWAELVQDLPELWSPITKAVIDSWVEYNERREGRRKNS